jgi:DNA polymerase-1
MHAWDTETIDLEIKEQTPVGNGKILSAQLFCGPHVPFENGPKVFIDNFGECKDLILLFKDYFEDEKYKKLWFNYGFDRHIFYNHGIDVKGFGGDVMHMARLLDSSREPQDYSLHKISKFYQKEYMNYFHKISQHLKCSNLSENEQKALDVYMRTFKADQIKISMNKIFARKKKLKDGAEGKIFEV